MYRKLRLTVVTILSVLILMSGKVNANIDEQIIPEVETTVTIPDAAVKMVVAPPIKEVKMEPTANPTPTPTVTPKIKEVKVTPTVTPTTPKKEEVKVVPKATPKAVKKIYSSNSKTNIVKKEQPTVSEKDIELLALLCMAEAEGECEKGKRLVIDTVLNRVDSNRFPNTISGVIYQKNQFSSMWNGRVNRCYVKEDICQLVREELKSRTNSEVLFFTAGRYGNYGTPMFRVENHYFSK